MFSHSPQHNITYSITLRKKEVIGHFMCTHFTLFYLFLTTIQMRAVDIQLFVICMFHRGALACSVPAGGVYLTMILASRRYLLDQNSKLFVLSSRATIFSCIYIPLLFGFQLENGIVISCFVESEMNLSHEHIICSFSHLIFLCANFCLTFMHGLELYPSFCTFFCTHNLSGVFTLSSCNDRKGKVDICRAAVIRFLVFFL